jgi:hypothetical protein
MILKDALNYGGRLYEAGTNVTGKLPLDLIEALKKNDKFQDSSDDFAADTLSGSIRVLSPEEFSELPAPEQKTRLRVLEIEPASKEEDRIAQYEEWFDEQLAGAHNGPTPGTEDDQV